MQNLILGGGSSSNNNNNNASDSPSGGGRKSVTRRQSASPEIGGWRGRWGRLAGAQKQDQQQQPANIASGEKITKVQTIYCTSMIPDYGMLEFSLSSKGSLFLCIDT